MRDFLNIVTVAVLLEKSFNAAVIRIFYYPPVDHMWKFWLYVSGIFFHSMCSYRHWTVMPKEENTK